MQVTIGLPFYNAEQTLLDAIRSVFAQTTGNWELLLVDDGSTDTSLRIAQAVSDTRVRVLSDGQNKGLAYRLNEIAALARSPYLARMDADDMMHPERIATQTAFLDAHPNVDVVGTAIYTIDSQNNVGGIRGNNVIDMRPQAVLRHGLFPHPTIMGRTEWFRRNPYDVALRRSQDHELWCRTCQQSSFMMLGEPLHFYREGDTFNLKNYLLSCQVDRQLFAAYGPALVGWRATLQLITGTYLKAALYWGATWIGIQNRLVERRKTSLLPQDAAIIHNVLPTILQTYVPVAPSQ